jgi:hypothetical protein
MGVIQYKRMIINNIRHLPFLVLLLIAFSCEQEKSGTYCYRLSDSTLSGICEVYVANRKTEMYSFRHYKDIRNGVAYRFDSVGDTTVRAYYRNGSVVRNYYEFYRSNIVKSYVYYDFNSDTLYARIYDSAGKITKEYYEESLFYVDGYNGISTLDLDKDSIIEVVSTVISPPKAKFKIKSYVTSDTDLPSDTIQPVNQGYWADEDTGIYSIKIKLKNRGKYRIYVETVLDDPDKGKIWRKFEGYTFSFPTE